ncbi:hypothetical protein C1H46_043312 [Malus baccata]|uniref:Uncharacterized protein n=1 Tax=Malus baccata TaxID=106549 RepID=A0A540KAA6_MALBA|nr:hypothetical protein C1H46_043312 [Malus baccata]
MKEKSREMGSSRQAEEIFRDYSGRRTDAVHALTNGTPISLSGKKKEGNAARYVTRSQVVKQLQVSLPLFSPWSEAPYKDAAERTTSGNLPLNAFLSEVSSFHCYPV